MSATAKRLAETITEHWSRLRWRLSPEEAALAPHLRNNKPLMEALTELIGSRIRGREGLPPPSDPLACKSIMERNHELRWLLSRLDFLHRSPENTGAEEHGEQPAA